MSRWQRYKPALGAKLAFGFFVLLYLGHSGMLSAGPGPILKDPWLAALLLEGLLLAFAVGFLPPYLLIRRSESRLLRVGAFVSCIPVFLTVPGLASEMLELRGRFSPLEAPRAKNTRTLAELPEEARHYLEAEAAKLPRLGSEGKRWEAAAIARQLERSMDVYSARDLGVRVNLAKYEETSRLFEQRRLALGDNCRHAPKLREAMRRDLSSVMPGRPVPAALFQSTLHLYLCEPDSPLVRQAVRALEVMPRDPWPSLR